MKPAAPVVTKPEAVTKVCFVGAGYVGESIFQTLQT